jgi:hypothetical protein
MTIDTEELRKVALRLYANHHGHDDRSEDFARDVIDQAEWFDVVGGMMAFLLGDVDRKQRRTDLSAITSSARKLRALLARSDIRCNFPMHDGRVIGYGHVLDQLERQVLAEREILRQHNRRGRPRIDIAVAAAKIRSSCLLFDVPQDCVLHLLRVIAPEADDKTLQAYSE